MFGLRLIVCLRSSQTALLSLFKCSVARSQVLISARKLNATCICVDESNASGACSELHCFMLACFWICLCAFVAAAFFSLFKASFSSMSSLLRRFSVRFPTTFRLCFELCFPAFAEKRKTCKKTTCCCQLVVAVCTRKTKAQNHGDNNSHSQDLLFELIVLATQILFLSIV